jgi:VWFA-related protein
MMWTALLAFTVAVPAAADQQTPTFGSEVGFVTVDVFAGRGGRPVEGLTAADFEVQDDGVPQIVELVSRRERPVYAILLLDVSASVAGPKLESLRGAARGLLEGLGENDRAALLTFSNDVRAESDLAASPATVTAALERVEAGGPTSLHDAVYAAVSLADPTVGRPIVLVFTDGEDRLSLLSAAGVLAAARQSPAAVYAVELQESSSRSVAQDEPRPGPAGGSGGFLVPPAATRSLSFLDKVVDETGGRLWHAGAAQELSASFLEVLEEVKNRYVLRYEPRGVSATGWHRLQVRLKDARATLRARKGYQADWKWPSEPQASPTHIPAP